jgi:hypothetical protein
LPFARFACCCVGANSPPPPNLDANERHGLGEDQRSYCSVTGGATRSDESPSSSIHELEPSQPLSVSVLGELHTETSLLEAAIPHLVCKQKVPSERVLCANGDNMTAATSTVGSNCVRIGADPLKQYCFVGVRAPICYSHTTPPRARFGTTAIRSRW